MGPRPTLFVICPLRRVISTRESKKNKNKVLKKQDKKEKRNKKKKIVCVTFFCSRHFCEKGNMA